MTIIGNEKHATYGVFIFLYPEYHDKCNFQLNFLHRFEYVATITSTVISILAFSIFLFMTIESTVLPIPVCTANN